MLTNIQLVDIVFGNGLFVAASTANTFATTSDGTSWSNVGLPGNGGLSAVVFGNGTFVGGGYVIGSFGMRSPVLWISTNAVNWTQVGSFPGSFAPTKPLTHGNGLFVSVMTAEYSGSTVAISTNGLDWIAQTNISFLVSAGTFGNGKFLLAGPNGFTLMSTNGVNWSSPIWSHDLLTDIQYASGVYVAVGGFWPFPAGTYGPVPGPTLLVSTNGRTFAPITTGLSHPLSSIAAGEGTFIAVGKGGGLYRSTDGLNWTRHGSGTLQDLHGVTYGNSRFVTVGEDGTILTSMDGLVWTLRFSGSAYPLYDVTYGNNLFVVVGYYGTVLTSSDAITWTAQLTDTSNALFSVTGGDGLFVTAGEGGTILTSNNGSDWIPRMTGTSMGLSGVTFGSGIFLAVGRNGIPLSGLPSTNVLLSSTDGVNWIHRNPRTRTRLHAAAYLNGSYWLAGEDGIILESGTTAQLRLFGQWHASNGTFELRSAGGQPDRVYRLQSCQDVDDIWSDVATLTNSAVGMYFLDKNASLGSNCFYRIVSP